LEIDKSKDKQYHFLFILYYFVVFFGGAIQNSFLNLYLNNAGMTPTNISIVNGFVSILSLFTMPFWGGLADRASSKNKILIIAMVFSTGLLFVYAKAQSLIVLAIMMILYNSCHQPMAGIYETITMDYVTRYGWKYSPIRMSGTIGYAVMAAIAGFYLSKKPDLLFPMFIASMIAATVIGCFLPKSKGVRREKVKKDKGEVRQVYAMLKDRRVLNVMILYMMYMMCNSFNNVQFSIYMKQFTTAERAVLYSGLSHTVMAMAEVPFHIGPGSRWLKKIGVEKSLCIVMAAGVLRWITCATCQSEYVLLLSMAFNGIMLVPTIVGVVEFIYERSPEHLKATAQTTLKTPFTLAGSMIASFGFGSLVSVFDNMGLNGIRTVYWIMSPLCLIAGLLVFVPLVKREKAEKKAANSAQ